MTRMTSWTLAVLILALAGIGLPGATQAHDPRGGGMGPGMMGPGYGYGPGYGMGPGMMGRGYGGYPMGPGMMGPGMMGPGMMGPGMMGPGMMGPGMMGPGMMGPGYGQMPGQGMRQALPRDLSTEDVRHMLEHRLAWQGNPNLKLGKVEAKDDDTIVAEIVTKDGSLVDRVEVDRHTGETRRPN